MKDHGMMDHATMNHSMAEHAAMGHSMAEHAMMNHTMADHSAMGHSMAGHAMMNHSGMDHSHSHAGMDMDMTFHFGVKEKVLFDSWDVNGQWTMLLSCVGIFFMAVMYEGIKYYRENLLWKTYNTLHYRAVDENAVPDSENHKSVVREVVRKDSPRMLSQKHLVQTGLHIIQLTVSYLLMLIFMTYNVWLCLAVVVGSAVGYFLFGWKRTVVVDMTETCH